jgi:hypothetical protein
MHGGSLIVASEIGRGTAVTVVLPKERVGPMEASEGDAKRAAA